MHSGSGYNKWGINAKWLFAILYACESFKGAYVNDLNKYHKDFAQILSDYIKKNKSKCGKIDVKIFLGKVSSLSDTDMIVLFIWAVGFWVGAKSCETSRQYVEEALNGV